MAMFYSPKEWDEICTEKCYSRMVKVLRRVAKKLRRIDGTNIRIVGHAQGTSWTFAASIKGSDLAVFSIFRHDAGTVRSLATQIVAAVQELTVQSGESECDTN